MPLKASKIRQTLDKKAPNAVVFLDNALNQDSKKKHSQKNVATVFKGDFKRLERVFGKNIF